MTTHSNHFSSHLQEEAWRYRWQLVLAGGIIMGCALGIRHVQGLLMQPVILERGWSREDFAWAVALQNLVWGLAQPFTGMVADRFGAVRVMLASAALYALGLVLMAQSQSTWLLTWGDGVLVGIALSGTGFAVVYGALSRLFSPAQRPWALGVAGALGGLGQFLMVPLTQSLLLQWHWQPVVLALAAVMAVAAPLALLLRQRTPLPAGGQAAPAEPAEPALDMRSALRQAFGHQGFWLLNAGFLACGFQLAFIAAHLPAYLLDQGLGAREAGICLALVALANVFGTYACSWAGGWMRRKYALALLYLVRSAIMLWFVLTPVSAATAYVFSVVMGLLWLGTVPLTNGLIAQVFGVRYLSTLFGFVFFGHQVGGFLGAWLGGLVYDATHSYLWLWWAAIALGVLAALLHWPIRDAALGEARANRLAPVAQ
ncbi:MFS transporter [Comamonas odontotermitis]|uniref:MFS transporter n=1 Tax=Comamonas odontotermitis TaxID=379895 RepID=UPI003751EBD7